jgi:serine/threonine protein kinase
VPGGKTRMIKDVLDENMSVASVTAISYQLANYLDLLHNSSITVENLSETNIFIRYRNKKVWLKINANLSDNTLLYTHFKLMLIWFYFRCLLIMPLKTCFIEPSKAITFGFSILVFFITKGYVEQVFV